MLPKDNDCQGSQEKAQPVGVAIDKEIQGKLTAEELSIGNAD